MAVGGERDLCRGGGRERPELRIVGGCLCTDVRDGLGRRVRMGHPREERLDIHARRRRFDGARVAADGWLMGRVDRAGRVSLS
jgi:hypothetical protein